MKMSVDTKNGTVSQETAEPAEKDCGCGCAGDCDNSTSKRIYWAVGAGLLLLAAFIAYRYVKSR